jgi:hypothetical protein
VDFKGMVRMMVESDTGVGRAVQDAKLLFAQSGA